MKKPLPQIAAAFLLLFSSGSFAAVPNFANLNLPQVSDVFETFGADLAFKPLEPASAYGKYWGISFGVIGNLTSASKITGSIPGITQSYIPGADIFIGAQAPYGIGVELGFLPNVSAGGAKFNTFGADLKWTVNQVFLTSSPVDFAVRFMITPTKLSYSQIISGVSDTVTFKSNMLGANFSVSKNFAIIEPYVGLGFIRQNATLSNTGSVQLFSQSVSLTNSFETNNSSIWFYGGFQLRLLVLTLTGEYNSIFGVSSYSAKLGFKI